MKTEAGERLGDLESRKQELEDKFKMFDSAETECSEQIKKVIKKNLFLKKADKDNAPSPIVKVEGKIIAGSLIQGRYSKIIISESRNKVKIMEAKRPETDYPDRNPWIMVISDL